MQIRIATSLDRDGVRSIYLASFAEDERKLVSKLAINLLAEKTTPKTISLVAETEGAVVGHVAFSPVTMDTDENCQGYILAPLGVQPEYQRRRIGSKLIERGMQQLSAMGMDILFVYGDPSYYSRFGFGADAAARYIPPYVLQYPVGWQGIALNEITGDKSPVKISCVTSLCDPELW